MAALTSALIAIAGLVLAWVAMEVACKPCLEKGREAIDRTLDPDYDPDGNITAQSPLLAQPDPPPPPASATAGDKIV